MKKARITLLRLEGRGRLSDQEWVALDYTPVESHARGIVQKFKRRHSLSATIRTDSGNPVVRSEFRYGPNAPERENVVWKYEEFLVNLHPSPQDPYIASTTVSSRITHVNRTLGNNGVTYEGKAIEEPLIFHCEGRVDVMVLDAVQEQSRIIERYPIPTGRAHTNIAFAHYYGLEQVEESPTEETTFGSPREIGIRLFSIKHLIGLAAFRFALVAEDRSRGLHMETVGQASE